MNSPVFEQDNMVTNYSRSAISDEQLVAAAKSGDARSFAELCERHAKNILPRIYRITKNRHDAEDVLQESLLKAFVHLKNFEARSSFSTWLGRIAVNSALMLLRKKRRSEMPLDDVYDYPQTWQAWEPRDHRESPESHYARRERERLLRSTILRLPERFREVIELQHEQEYSVTEIAQALGISVAAAKTRLTRARRLCLHRSRRRLTS